MADTTETPEIDAEVETVENGIGPTPNIPDLIKQLTIEEKVKMLSGANFWHTVAVPRLNIPSIMMTDGPNGLRKQAGTEDHLGLNNSTPATSFPTSGTLANSWDPALAQSLGVALGAEAAHHDVAMVLGPGLNIIRDPKAGRGFEYFSEDPLLAGEMAAGSVRGIQTNGVAATVKHFAVNSQEHLRMSIDEVVDERTLREIYLEGFRRAVAAEPKAIMTSYNKVNGEYANENTHLLKDILFGEWGYKGMPVTDWGGMNNPVAAAKVGAVLEMPTSNGISDAEFLAALKAGEIDEVTIDARVTSLLNLVYEGVEAVKNAADVDYDAHHDLAVKAAGESAVLLKNDSVQSEDGSSQALLPLREGSSVAVIGDFAAVPRYQGAGSSLVNPTKLTNALESFKNSDLVKVLGYEPGFNRVGKKNSGLVKKAVKLAKKADVAVVFLGLDEAKESEGIDRKTLALPSNQLELLDGLLDSGVKNIVVVLSAGGVLELPFVNEVPSILHTFLGGQGSGVATVDVLTGKVNPSGKLAVTSPIKYEDTPTAKYFPGREATAEHREGLYVGYRYYETVGAPVRFPFGYGLSYTSFVYSDVVATENEVSFTILNNGSVAGAEIAQVYVHPLQPSVFRPKRELKGFAKVTLQPGESQRVTVKFDDHTFAYYSVQDKTWTKDTGAYEVEVSASVQDIRLRASVRISALGIERVSAVDTRNSLPSYNSGAIRNVSDVEYAALLGRPLPPALWDRTVKPKYHDAVAQLEYGYFGGRVFLKFVHFVARFFFAIGKPNAANNISFLTSMTFAKFPRFTNNKLSEAWLRKKLKDPKN